jgi:hypothetical protein
MFDSKLILSAFASLFVLPVGADEGAKAIIEKAITARGGRDELLKCKAMELREIRVSSSDGTSTEVRVRTSVAFPDKFRQEMDFEVFGQKEHCTRILDGKIGWEIVNGHAFEFKSPELDQLRDIVHANYVASLISLIRGTEIESTLIGEEVVGGKAALSIKVSAKGYSDVRLSFDKQSGTLLKSTYRAEQPVDNDVFYADFKKIGGLLLPMKAEVKQNGKLIQTIRVTDCKILEKVDNSIFAKPLAYRLQEKFVIRIARTVNQPRRSTGRAKLL